MNADEEWRDIAGYEGFYQVSSRGRVRSLDRITSDGKHLKGKLKTSSSKYRMVTLYKDSQYENVLVHRLVANAFLPNPDDLPEVDHIDGDPSNNSVNNLRWVTCSQNAKNKSKSSHYRRSVTCLNTGQQFQSISAAARFAGTDVTRVIESIESKSQCKDFIFVYTDSMPDDIKGYIASAKFKYQSFHNRPAMLNSKQVRCRETGQIFDSRAAAARYYNCDPETITNRINAKKSFNNVTIEWYVD